MLSHARRLREFARVKRVNVTPPRIFIFAIGIAIQLPHVTDFVRETFREEQPEGGIQFAKVGGGKTILKYQKDQIVFSQGNAVFYIQKGKIKLTVVSERGKEAVGQYPDRRIRSTSTADPVAGAGAADITFAADRSIVRP
jgi:hypothetical protein